jgi:uncharacterized protein (DUF1697 family)
MKYIALFRGINVGGNRKVEMKKLKALFETIGYTNVSTYLNSGNALFESDRKKDTIQKEIELHLEKEFGFKIQTLVKSEKEMKQIADAIPVEWENDTIQKTDVAYLFPEIDSKQTLDDLPVNKECIDIRYVKGALFWNVSRDNYNKSKIDKIIGLKIYRLMTVRNINTARFLAGYPVKGKE